VNGNRSTETCSKLQVGNDDDYVDSIFVDLWEHYNQTCFSETSYLGYEWIPAALSISAHGPFGRACGASPDGRLAGLPSLTNPFGYSRTDVNGPIALLNSGVKLDPTPMRSVQLNMKMHPSPLKAPRDLKTSLTSSRLTSTRAVTISSLTWSIRICCVMPKPILKITAI